MATRLFRTIVVFGTTLGAAAAFGPGCSLSGDSGDDSNDDSGDDVPSGCDGPWGIIDAPSPYDAEPDARWGIIDAALPDAAPPPDAAGDPT